MAKRKGRKIKDKKPAKSLILDALDRKKVNEDINNDHLVFSFRYLDESQGFTIKQWELDGHWAKTVDKLRHYSKMTRPDACKGRNSMAVYGDFPAKDRTTFKHPDFIPPDANWCRIHIQGNLILAGHIFQTIFYVVFLDPTHDFYQTKRKREN